MTWPAWQPIETAPKDGTSIIVCEKQRLSMWIASWQGKDEWRDNVEWHPLEPVVWLSLPPLPTEEDER
jgi:hypothetical protein